MPELVTNPTIETNDTGWGPFFSSCTSARSTAQFHNGAASLALAAVGANAYIGVNEFPLNMVVGVTHTASWWVRVPTTATYTPVIQNANGDWSFSGSSGSITADTWTQVTVASIIPTTWDTSHDVAFRLNRSTGTYSGETVYFDDLSLISAISAGAGRLLLLGCG